MVADSEMGGERPRGCLETGTAHPGARGVSPQRGHAQGASRFGSKTSRGWRAGARVAASSPHASCPWPLKRLGFSLRTSSSIKFRVFSFAELGIHSVASGFSHVWRLSSLGRPAGQMEIRAFRKCLRRLIPEVVACLYGPKSPRGSTWPRLGPSQRRCALGLEENFRRVPGWGMFAGLGWSAEVERGSS